MLCLIVQREEWYLLYGWMKNVLHRKWIHCSSCIILNLDNVCSYVKKEKSKLSMTDWPWHVWLQKNSMTHLQGSLGVCYRVLCTNLYDGISCTLSSNHNIRRENEVYQRYSICPWSQKVCRKCIFKGSGDPNLKISSVPTMGAPHEILT